MSSMTKILAPLAIVLVAGCGSLTKVERRGGQIEGLVGLSACMPGRASCERGEGATITVGDTRPSFGAGVNAGWRATRWLMLGGAYRFGMLDPDYDLPYNVAYQHSGYFVVRPILPVWRLDFGLDLGPGGSRQTFRLQNGDMDFSQGFSFLVGPTVDLFITRRVFLGAKVDLLINGHRTTCRERGDRTTCTRSADEQLAPVHQVLFGLHIGATFG
jgi:hypothetical protein